MKNPVRNVVVEYKNKRARKGNVSLWGNLDLKSIAREVEADTAQPPIDVHAKPGSSEPTANNAKIKVLEVSPVAAEKLKDAAIEREPTVSDVVETQKATNVPDPVSEPDIVVEIDVMPKRRSVQRGSRKIAPQKKKKATLPLAEPNIHSELLSLESENASLKRELISKLRVENENLLVMITRADQRITNSR